MSNATAEAVLDNVRARLPGVETDLIKLELYGVVDELAREVLRVSAPTNVDADPDTWLSSEYWAPNYQLLLDGVLARLYAQPSKPWSSKELAEFHYGRYTFLGSLARTTYAGTAASTYARLINTMRAQLPGARDESITLELFNTIDELQREALRGTPPVATDAATSWLSSGDYATHFQLLLDGTLARLFAQPGQPWTSDGLAKIHAERHGRAIQRARADAGSTAASAYARLINTMRAQLPDARDSEITTELFNTIDELQREALRGTPPVATDAATSWLSSGDYATHFQLLLDGTLARMFAQVGKPWASEGLAKLHVERHGRALQRASAEAGSTAASAYARLVNTLRAQLPEARDSEITLELFNAVDELQREALRGTPPVATDVPTAWLSAGDYATHFQVLMHSTLARMFAQVGKPWSSDTLGKFHLDTYTGYLDQARTDAAGEPDTVYERLINALRVQLPFARDNAILLELFATANTVRREVLRLAPLDSDDSDPDEWVPEERYDDCYMALFHGTLARMFAQFNKRWSNPDLARIHGSTFQAELDRLRGAEADTSGSGSALLMELLRVQLPGALDNVIQLELASVLREFFERTLAWVEEVPVTVRTTRTRYDVPAEATISRLIKVCDADERLIQSTLEMPDVLVLRTAPNATETYTVHVALIPMSQTPLRIPEWAWETYQNAFMHGVLGRMMLQHGKPYTNHQLAVLHTRRFHSAIAGATSSAARKYGYGRQAWVFPRMFV